MKLYYHLSALVLVVLTILPSMDATDTYRRLPHDSDDSIGGSAKGPPQYSMSMSMETSYPPGPGTGAKGLKKGVPPSPPTKAAKKAGPKANKKGPPKGKKKGKSAKGSGGYPGGKGGGVPTSAPVSMPSSAKYRKCNGSICSCLSFASLTFPVASTAATGSRPPYPTPAPTLPSSTSYPSPSSAFTPYPVGPSVNQSQLQQVTMSEYAISYTLSQAVIPMRQDYIQLESATNDYFNSYIRSSFPGASQGSLVEFTTALQTSDYRYNQPIVVYYKSTAYFTENYPTSSLPTPSTLETLLQLSLKNPTVYLNSLKNLGPQNAFYFTQSVQFNSTTNTTGTPTSTSSGKSGASPATIAAGAVGAALLVAGVVIYRRRVSGSEEEYYMQKDLNKRSGGATVAGETFAGETYDGTVSVAPSSQISSRDEEQGLATVDLNEAEDRTDHAVDNLSMMAPNRFGSADYNESDNVEHTNRKGTSVGEDGVTEGDHWGAFGSSHDDSTLATDEANSCIRPPASQSPAASMDESSTIYEHDENNSTSPDAYLGALNGNMSMDSVQNEQVPEDERELRPLSVEEIEAMLAMDN